MHKTPRPGPDDYPLCVHTESDLGADFSLRCVCSQGCEGKGRWRVYVDRNGVAYTVWGRATERPF